MGGRIVALIGGTGRLGSPIGNSVLDKADVEDLDARIEQLKRADPASFRAYLPLTCYRSMLNGEGQLQKLTNDRYPSIRPTSFRGYVVQEGL